MYLFYLVLYVRVALNAKNVISNVDEISLTLYSTKLSTDPLPCGTPPNLGGEFLFSSCATCDLSLLVLSKLISFIFPL